MPCKEWLTAPFKITTHKTDANVGACIGFGTTILQNRQRTCLPLSYADLKIYASRVLTFFRLGLSEQIWTGNNFLYCKTEPLLK